MIYCTVLPPNGTCFTYFFSKAYKNVQVGSGSVFNWPLISFNLEYRSADPEEIFADPQDCTV